MYLYYVPTLYNDHFQCSSLVSDATRARYVLANRAMETTNEGRFDR